MVVESCAARASLSRCVSTTSKSRDWGRLRRMGSTTSPPTRVGSMSGSTPIRRHSPSRASVAGGSASARPNGARVHLWKRELQNFANQTGLAVTVVHLPPGTSKWNRIEHRLFAYITQNWRGKPLVSHKVIVQLIAATSTDKGLTVTCGIDRSRYPCGIKVSKAELAAIKIERHSFHGEWNYTIKPNKKSN